MGEIKKYKVGELVVNFDRKRKPLSGRQREKMKGIYPYYGAACIFDYINDYIFDGEYILLGEDGTVVNSDGTPVLQRISGKSWVNNHAHVLRNSEIIDFDYLYYVLKNTNFSGAVTGAVQPKISQANMNAVEVEIYEDKKDQKKVAGIIKSLDEKIKLNNKINDNLSDYRSIDSTFISPDISLGSNESLRFDNLKFSKAFKAIARIKGSTCLSKSRRTLSGGIGASTLNNSCWFNPGCAALPQASV